ncbi:MAG: heavy metal translocating P-type ATPase [Burkholderiales bacterium]|nr:heavy metal translocating P-type ATPase [Burkholderiales bacterium]
MSASSALPAAGPAVATREAAANSTCYHCGAPNPARGRWREIIAGTPREFCCAGCVAVARTVHAAGLDSLYAGRSAPALRADAAADDWTRWGDAAEAGGLVRSLPDGYREASLLIEGMNCGACVPLVESWLARQPGVAGIDVNYASRRATVRWHPDRTRLSALLRAIAAVGYAAYPYDPARREALARRERRALLTRMAIALLAMMQVMMFALPLYLSADDVAPEHRRLLDWASLVLTLPVLVFSASPFFAGARRDVRHRRLGMDIPIVIGVTAAFIASASSVLRGDGPVYFDSVTMFIALLLVARYVELIARQRGASAIEAVARARADTALLLPRWPSVADPDTVAAATLEPGDMVLIRPGALVPADGEVVDGRSQVAEAMLTGESVPVSRGPGDSLWAGAVNGADALVMRVRCAGEDTRLSAILRLSERAASARPAVARTADRVAAYFVGGLLVLAAGTAAYWLQSDPARALPVTFAVLAVSCPCALALATPAALAAAAGALARSGVVIARADALETLARVTHVVFDKTGTLTEGRIRLTGVATPGDGTRADALRLAAALATRSEHPLARALADAAPGDAPHTADALRQTAGEGIAGCIGDAELRLGRPEFVAALAGPMPAALAECARRCADTLVALGGNRGWHALFTLSDTLRPGAAEVVAQLDAMGIETLLLSGDRQASVAAVARRVGIGDARAQLRPEDKRDAIARLQREGAVVAMVGDGINDAPALAQAQVSVSLGSAAPLAQWTADAVILSDRVESIALMLHDARRTFRIIRQNLGWALMYNMVAVPAAAFGLVTPLLAAAGMSLSSLVVVGNALRLTRPRMLHWSGAAVTDIDAPEAAWKS